MAQIPQAGQSIGQAAGQGVAQALKSAGIGTLPQQGQGASAKAPMSMAPQGGGVAMSYAPMLEKMPIQRLLAEFNNPGSQIPKYALLGAIDQAQKKNKAMQAVQGQMAMAQNAQAQQQGTVTDQVMGEAMQGGIRAAATGGVMRYASGGISKNPYDQLYAETQKEKEEVPRELTPKELAAQAAERMAQEESREKLQRRIDEPLTEDIKKSRAGLASLAEEEKAAQAKRLSDYTAQMEADRAAKEQQAGRWGFREFMDVASFDPTGRNWVGDLAGRVAGVGARQDTLREEARKEYREAQITMRAMEDTKRQMARLEAQRMDALANGDMKALREAEDGILKAQADLATLQSSHAKAARTAKTEGIKAIGDLIKTQEGILGKKDLADYYRAMGAAAQTKATGAGFKLSQAQARIISDAQKQAEKLVSPTGPLAVEYATADEAGKQAIREREKRRIAAEQWRAAGYDLEHLDAALQSTVPSPVSAAPGTRENPIKLD